MASWVMKRDRTTGVERWAVAGTVDEMWPGWTVTVTTQAGKATDVELGYLCEAHRKRGAMVTTVLAWPA